VTTAAIVSVLGSSMPVFAEEPGAQSTRPAYVVVLNDASTIPTVVIDGEAIAGFSQGWIESRVGR
jgi:hypothetical protein